MLIVNILSLFCCCCCCCYQCYIFVLLLCWFFENNCKTKMNLKVSVIFMEKKLRKRSSKIHHQRIWLSLTLLCCCCCYWCSLFVDCLKIRAKEQWNWMLKKILWNKRTAESQILNIPSGDRMSLTLCYFCCFCSLFCDVTADIVWIKQPP